MAIPTASERIATFVAEFDGAALSDAHVHAAARAFLDTYATAVAGQGEEASLIALEYGRAQGQAGEWFGSVWASGERLPLESAALVNGVMAHVLDYDDVSSPLRAHVSAAFFPALVGIAESIGATGRQVSAAYVVGVEVAVKLASPFVSAHYAKGWHSTSSVGVLGATAACAHLLGLTAEQTVNALGLAVAQASGTRANFGTMAKSFQAGHCGAVAGRAVSLARLGFTASPTAIDGECGYMTLYAGGEEIDGPLAQLGREPLALDESGLEVKKYPLCYATHRALDGILDLRAEHQFDLVDVESVEVVTNFRGMAPLLFSRPRTGLEGKFSMEYAMAAAIADGDVRLSSFEDEVVRRPEIQTFMPKVRASEASGPAMPRWAEVTVRLADGRTIQKRVDALRGGAELPLTDEQLAAKARDCFAFAGVERDADAFVEAVFGWADRPVANVIASSNLTVARSS